MPGVTSGRVIRRKVDHGVSPKVHGGALFQAAVHVGETALQDRDGKGSDRSRVWPAMMDHVPLFNPIAAASGRSAGENRDHQ